MTALNYTGMDKFYIFKIFTENGKGFPFPSLHIEIERYAQNEKAMETQLISKGNFISKTTASFFMQRTQS